MNAQTRMIVGTLIAGIAAVAALWVLAIAPKRSDNARVQASVAAQQTRLTAAQAQVTSYRASRKRLPGLMAELKRLDRAVPTHGDIANLLRQLQRRARLSGSDLRLAVLKTGAAAPAAGAAPLTPGATAGPDGLATLPFTFEYNGKYFDLVRILRAVRKSVTVRSSGDLSIDGRLLTIDGLSFQRVSGGGARTKAVVNATAYIAPDGASTSQAPASSASAGGK
jgi:Tfp pilus assembly protein PilO